MTARECGEILAVAGFHCSDFGRASFTGPGPGSLHNRTMERTIHYRTYCCPSLGAVIYCKVWMIDDFYSIGCEDFAEQNRRAVKTALSECAIAKVLGVCA